MLSIIEIVMEILFQWGSQLKIWLGNEHIFMKKCFVDSLFTSLDCYLLYAPKFSELPVLQSPGRQQGVCEEWVYTCLGADPTRRSIGQRAANRCMATPTTSHSQLVFMDLTDNNRGRKETQAPAAMPALPVHLPYKLGWCWLVYFSLYFQIIIYKRVKMYFLIFV